MGDWDTAGDENSPPDFSYLIGYATSANHLSPSASRPNQKSCHLLTHHNLPSPSPFLTWRQAGQELPPRAAPPRELVPQLPDQLDVPLLGRPQLLHALRRVGGRAQYGRHVQRRLPRLPEERGTAQWRFGTQMVPYPKTPVIPIRGRFELGDAVHVPQSSSLPCPVPGG
jgi:hypothetical protein